ncbi:SymE family type I addiction module toxin [uncultured Pedobacter sp.]|uniref:SymE family type I addiction module toxin n=1 Tax=uncultured Pedobacter sp. TaxID=246139 RepID=UPI0025E302EC|nr:SymE family type I addiction module toxin [uncultured Pedobacter sp.]
MRRLKIQPKCRDYAWNRSIVPQIMLQGKWLEQIGFECHSHVIITALQGKLVIEIDKE